MKKSRAIGGRSLRKEPERTATPPVGRPSAAAWPRCPVASLHRPFPNLPRRLGRLPRRSVSLAEWPGNLPEWFGNLPQPARNLPAWFSNLPRPAGNPPERFRKPAIYPPILDKHVPNQQLASLNPFQTSNLN